MDAFEQIAGQLLEADRFWVRHSVKINLSKEEKAAIGKATTPRPEIDIVALDHKNNKIYLLEVKSYLDSHGVNLREIDQNQETQSGRYKILTSKNYQDVIKERLRRDWVDSGHIDEDTEIGFGLIAGKTYLKTESEIEAFFEAKNWFFWGPRTIKEKLEKLSKTPYENNAVTIAAKLLMRN